MGLRVGLDGCGKSRLPTGIRSPDRPARSLVAIPTALSRPATCLKDSFVVQIVVSFKSRFCCVFSPA